MKDILIYRGVFVVIGVIFAFFVTQSAMDNQTQMWLIVAYIVIGITITEILRKSKNKNMQKKAQ